MMRKFKKWLNKIINENLIDNWKTTTEPAGEPEHVRRSPGEILREDFMQPLSISINQLSRDLSVPPNRISEIVNGKRSITADTALKLQRYFGIEAQFWLNLQTEFDLRMLKRKIWSDIELRIIPVNATETGIEHNAGA